MKTKELKDNFGKKIKFKKKRDSTFRFGIITEVSGNTREFNCGSDWHSFADIKEYEIY